MKNSHKTGDYFGKDLEAMSVAVNYHQWIINEFQAYLGKNVAEVGAGTGNITELILENVNHLTAYEPSENMHFLLKNRFADEKKIHIINDLFDGECEIGDDSFDSVIYINVLEHVENDKKELMTVYKRLIHGGHVLIVVPALSFLFSDFDKKIGHFRRYCKKDFKLLAAATGFKIKKIKYMDIAGILPWYICFVLLKNDLQPNSVWLYDRLVIPFMRKIESRTIPPIGKNLIVVMQKTS